MYQAIPDIFVVPICYVEKNSLGIKIEIIHQFKYNSDFINIITNRKQIVVGVSLPTLESDIWVNDKESLEKYANMKEVVLKVENANYDSALQATQVDKLISQGIDVLILSPLDAFAATAMVEKAKKAGVKVIAYHRLVNNSDLDLYISFDTIKIGELQGKFLINTVPKGNYIVLSGDLKDNNSKMYKEGAMKYIQPFINIGAIKIVTLKEINRWDPIDAYNVVKQSLNANNTTTINAILAPNDTTAGGAIKALEEQGLAGKVVVTGQDAQLQAIKRILNQTQSMTVLKDIRESSKIAIDSAIKLANGESLDTHTKVDNGKINVPSIILTPKLVTNANLVDTIINSGYMKWDQIHKI